ncbi:hypothetical protein [Kocuria sp. KH4]
MELQLCVAAEIDPDGHRLRLAVSGALTTTNQQLLASVITGCRVLSVGAVVVDLRAAQCPEDTAVDLLLWELEHDPPAPPARPVGLLLPGPGARSSGCGAAPTCRTVWVGATRGGDP